MERAVTVVVLLAMLMLPGCIYSPQQPEPLPLYIPTATPVPSPTAAPSATAEQGVSPQATPTPTPATAGSYPCERILREQIYQRYQPSYCTGMPPCTNLTEEEIKAKISLDLRQAPAVVFTYQQGTQCGVTTYTGRAWFVPTTCDMHDETITGQSTVPVPC